MKYLAFAFAIHVHAFSFFHFSICFYRFVIKASFVSSSVCSSHGPAPLQLSDSRPDLYSMTELHLLCNEWVECTASQTADNQAACDSLLTQLVAALKRWVLAPGQALHCIIALHHHITPLHVTFSYLLLWSLILYILFNFIFWYLLCLMFPSSMLYCGPVMGSHARCWPMKCGEGHIAITT